MNGSYKLKWLTGLLAGRELMLPPGEIRLGGSDPDIAVTLENGGEAVLEVDDAGVRLSSQEPIWVGGERWDRGEHLPLNVAIDVAGQAFILGAAADTLASAPVPARCGGAHWRKRTMARVSGGAAWIVALGSMAALWVLLVLLPSKPSEEAAPSKVGAALVDQLQKGPLRGLHVVKDRDGLVALSGYCANSADVDTLRQQLQDEGVLFRDDTVCVDVLRRGVRDLLHSNGYEDSDVENGAAPGSVVIRGDFTSDSRWRLTVEQLRAMRGLRDWSIVNDSAESFERLLRILTDRDLLDGIGIRVSERMLIVSGALPPARMRMLEDVVAAFNRDADGLPAKLEDVAASADAADLLPAPIASVGGNAKALFVELENGMRVQRGAVLPNGFAVYALGRSFIELRKGMRLVAVPLGL